MTAIIRRLTVVLFYTLVFCQPNVAGAITIDTVPVNNPGNPLDSETGLGGVGYDYRIGTTEVTVGQYTAFLNAVAADDTWGLYTNFGVTSTIPDIARSGDPGNYTYAVIGSPNRPVTYVNWGDAARFANWLHNGQPVGAQNASTTEDGAYTLNGANYSAALSIITRNPGATWFLPSEDEWYKAAYHQNDGPTGNYWDYPTASDSAPLAELPPGGTNSANYGNAVPTSFWELGITDVKLYLNSPSPYGTFDQAGNLAEWTEGIESPESSGVYLRGIRGGSWAASSDALHTSPSGFFDNPTLGGADIGFRVATIPEPATLTLALVGACAFVAFRLRQQWKRAAPA